MDVSRSRKRRFVLDQATMQGHDVQRLPAERIYAMFPTMVCEDHLADPDTVYVFDNYLGVFRRRNPPCNAEDKIARGLIVIEAWFRGY